MLSNGLVKKEVDKFRKGVVRKAKNGMPSASGRGKKSIGSTLKISPNSFELSFLMEPYVEFQDRGVDGVKTKRGAKGFDGRKLAYTNKRPPTRVFDRWSIRRGLAPRTGGGQFASRESMKFALSIHIFKHGIKPKKFFTRPFEQEFRKLPDKLIKAYGLEMEKLLKGTTKN